VNRLGNAFVRPHDVELMLNPNGTTQEAMVERIVHLGFEVRVELVRDDGEQLTAQITKEQAELLELERGQILFVRSARQMVFDSDGLLVRESSTGSRAQQLAPLVT
jgi:sulfate transport system ATP-binding protein